ncbi:MAG TPA: SIS domain-containing protein [Chloroflexota bacterium]|nr:SIS domain-containing protein [Chloroflexota bacterium]
MPEPGSALYAGIFSQPAALRAVLGDSDAAARAAAALIARRVWLVGTGTSHHAAQVGAYMLTQAGLFAVAVGSFEFVSYPRALGAGDAVVVISHTGTTTYARSALDLAIAAGAATVVVTGLDSSFGEGTPRLLTTIPETSATYTVSYLAALGALALTAGKVADLLGRSLDGWQEALRALPEAVGDVPALTEQMRASAENLATQGRLVLVGAGPNAATAREGALKVKESCYLVAEGFEVETFLHGGLQAVEAGDLAVVIAVAGPGLHRVRDAARALTLVGARLLLVVDRAAEAALAEAIGPAVSIVRVPDLPEALSPLVTTVPLQLLAALTAEILGTDADDFRCGEPRFGKVYAGLTL